MATPPAFPANVHVSQHACLQAKLAQLRSRSADAARVKTLVHEIATVVLVETLGSALSTTIDGQVGSHPFHPHTS